MAILDLPVASLGILLLVSDSIGQALWCYSKMQNNYWVASYSYILNFKNLGEGLNIFLKAFCKQRIYQFGCL